SGAQRPPTRPPTMAKVRELASVGLLTLLGGCLAPSHVRPEAPVAPTWPGAPGDESEGVIAAELGWREFFADEQLQEFIATALENNRDLRISALRVERARAMYNIRRAAQLPSINAEVSAASTRQIFGPGLAAEGTI